MNRIWYVKAAHANGRTVYWTNRGTVWTFWQKYATPYKHQSSAERQAEHLLYCDMAQFGLVGDPQAFTPMKIWAGKKVKA